SPALRADRAYNLGWSWLLAGNGAEARRCFAQTLRLTPRRAGAWLWYALSALPGPLRRAAVSAWFGFKRLLKGGRTRGVISWSEAYEQGEAQGEHPQGA
ncbi:MAG: hypothetical protein AB7Y46_14405, partial [Armatimonadota bacterium]